MTFDQIIESGLVRRYHTEPIPIHQTNSQHQWGVAVILLHISPDCSLKLLKAALLHDVAERIAGDMPAPFKWANPQVNVMLEDFELITAKQFEIHHHLIGLTDEETYLLKLADYLEAASFSYSLYKQGVHFGLTIFHNLYTVLQNRFQIGKNPAAVALFNQLLKSLHEIAPYVWCDAHPLLYVAV